MSKRKLTSMMLCMTLALLMLLPGLSACQPDSGIENPNQEQDETTEHQSDTLHGSEIDSDVTTAPDAQPNAAHRKLAQWEQEGKLKAVITQNIDNLHQKAGSREVLELHGSAWRNYCRRCGAFYGIERIVESRGVPRCSCGGTIKPDVVLYEEGLDEDTIARAVHHIRQADMLIIGGTSLVVYPAAGLVRYFRGKHLVVINKGETGADADAELVIDGAIGQVLGQL